MESTRPIRALMRGLDALALLNNRNGATVAEIAQHIKLPRTTTYRILETLSRAGYVRRDAADDRYRLTIMVHRLAHGFDDDAWITEIARPCLTALGSEVVWPVGLASLCGTQIVVRETTDRNSPLAVERMLPGTRLPLLQTSAGRACLAFMPPPERDTLIELLRQSHGDGEPLAHDRQALDRLLEETRARGYATAVLRRSISDETTLAVPVLLQEKPVASVVIRFASAAVPMPVAVERFVPKLRDTARRIVDTFQAQRREPPFQSAAS